MMSGGELIRDLSREDWFWVSKLSAANEIETSPLDEIRFGHMIGQSLISWAYGDHDAYLIVFDQDSDYDSPNFLWFKSRYPKFAYVDRIVVAETARGKGVARALYEELFRKTRDARFDKIVCEVNFAPPNPASDAFHAKLGFAEVGRTTLANGKGVRYLLRQL